VLCVCSGIQCSDIDTKNTAVEVEKDCKTNVYKEEEEEDETQISPVLLRSELAQVKAVRNH